jgi:hypothetical protein
MYEAEMSSIGLSDLIDNEVILNNHNEGGLMIDMETDTRIYHIQESTPGRIKDIYYMDGNGKTLVITFDTKADIFP